MRATEIALLIAVVVVATIFMASEVLADYCYQETANVSTSCGGLATGTMSCDFTTTPAQTYDGNWTLYGQAGTTNQTFQVNYTKPSWATNSSLWTAKQHDAASIYNFSIAGCWNASPTLLIVRARYDTTGVSMKLECYNGTEWILVNSSSSARFTEDAMYWAFPFNSSIGYNTNALEYSNQTFTLNFTYQNITNITANLTYNGTTYTTTGTNDSTTWNFTKSIIIPAVSAAYNESKSFYWTYYVQYASENATYNTSTYNQTAYQLVITNLTTIGANTYTHAFYNEETPSSAVTSNITTYFGIWSPENKGNVSRYRYYNYTDNSVSTKTYKIYPAWANATIWEETTITAVNYTSREHYFCEKNISNSSFTQAQYLLSNSSDYTKVYFTLKDVNQQVLSEHILTFERYYANTNNYLYLSARKTDDFGQAVERFIEDNKVRIRAYDSDCALQKEWIFVLTCQETPCVYDLTLTNLTDPFETINEWPNFAYSWDWNRDTKILTLGWEDQNEPTEIDSVELNVWKRNVASDDDLVCTNSSVETTGSMVCNLSNYSSGDFLAKMTAETNSTFERWYNFATIQAKDVFGVETLVFAALIFIALFFVGIWNPVVAVSLLLLGVVVVGIIGFAALSWIMFVLIAVVGIVIIIKLRS